MIAHNPRGSDELLWHTHPSRYIVPSIGNGGDCEGSGDIRKESLYIKSIFILHKDEIVLCKKNNVFPRPIIHHPIRDL